MTSRVQAQRFTTTNTVPATGTRPQGEFYVNFPDLKMGVINPSQQALDLLGVRRFTTSASYAIGDYAVYTGILYRATATIAPGSFNGNNWDMVMGRQSTDALYTTRAQDDARYVQLMGSTMQGFLTLSGDPTNVLHATTKQYVDAADAARVPLAGGTMTGPLILSGDPTTVAAAANKNYVDAWINTRLPLSGGALSGTLTVNNGRIVSVNNAGNPSVTVWDTSRGAAKGMFMGSGDSNLYFGEMDGGGNYVGPVFGYFSGSDFHAQGDLYAGGNTHSGALYLSNNLGVNYSVSGHWFSFGWNGNVNMYMDGGYVGDAATTSWVSSTFAGANWVSQNFATYGWVQGNYLPLGGGHITGSLGCDGPVNFGLDLNIGRYWDTGDHGNVGGTGIYYKGTGSVHGYQIWWPGGAGMYIRVDGTYDVGVGTSASDQQFKQDIAPSTLDCLEVIRRTKLFQYRWKKLTDSGPKQEPGQLVLADPDAPLIPVGFIAQEMQKLLPESVFGERSLNIDPMTMIAALVGAVQQLADEVYK